jgi:pilus assembly protein Flp/PilA
MKSLNNLVSRLLADTRGTTAIEYGLIVALIAVACIGGMRALGSSNSSGWGNTSTKLTDAMKK